LNADVDAVYQDLDRALADDLPALVREHLLTGVYAYEDGACESFRRGQELGLIRFYDLPIAYWEEGQRLLREEAKLWPEWAPTMPGLRDTGEKNARKTLEASLADAIVCPSRFVYDSLPAAFREKAVVAEFGSPDNHGPREIRRSGEVLRVLFAGSMTQRKGLADLFAAMKSLRRYKIELTVMGSLMAPMEFYRRQFADFVYEPPRPHQEVLRLMDRCDVLVLPSIVEGRALVQQEAMSRGLAVIATANAGAQDLLKDGRAGFLVPIRSPGLIAEKLVWMRENPAAFHEMKRAAFEKASALTWRGYTDKIMAAMDSFAQQGRNAGTANVTSNNAHA
jgi:glycosyltransferase involved in cell wall biosynthesis